MKARTLGYLAREALDGVRRNGVMSLASVTTVAVALAILSVFAILGFNVQHLARSVESQVEVVAFLQEGFDRSQQDALLEQVRALPGVAEARYVTREEALARLKRQFGDQKDLLDAIEQDNPLRDSVEVRVPEPPRVEGVAAALQKLAGVEKVVYQRDTVRRLYRLTAALRALGLFLGVLVGLATLLIVSNTIRISVFARRREIAIMKLVGATDAFVRWPFVLEGALLGLLGALVASAVAWAGYLWLVGQVAVTLPFIPMLPPHPFLWHLARALVLLGAAMGAAGSVVSVRRHLRV